MSTKSATAADGNRAEVGPRRRLSGPMFAAAACLLGLGVNAVVIQTVVTDPGSPLKQVVRIAVLAIAVWSMFVYRTQIPRWMALSLILSAALMLLRNNPDQLSYCFVLALAPLLWSIGEKRVLAIAAVASGVSLALIFALLALGITHNEVLDYRSRATFGTLGVPFFFNVVYGACSLAILYAVVYRPRLWWTAIPTCVAFATYLFGQTDARGGYLSLLIFVGLIPIVRACVGSPVFRVVVGLMPTGFFLLAFLLASLWRSAYYNDLLSYRPQLLHGFLSNISASDFLLSRTVKQFSESVHVVRTVDNSYLHLLVGCGLLSALVFCVAFYRAVGVLCRNRMSHHLAFLIATMAYCNSESILLRIENVFIVYAWYLILYYAARPSAPSAWGVGREHRGIGSGRWGDHA